MSEFSFVKESINNQTPDETLLVLTYELKNIARCQWMEDHDLPIGYEAHKKSEIGDLISMLRMYCEQICENYNWITQSSILNTYSQTLINLSKSDLVANLWIQLGNIINSHHYIKRFGTPKQHGNITHHLACFKYTLDKYISNCGLVWYELEKQGEEHYRERMEQLKKEGLKDQLKEEYK